MKHHVTVHSISSTWSESTAMMAVIAESGMVGVDVTTSEKPVVLFRFEDTFSRVTLLQFEDENWLSEYLYKEAHSIAWAKRFICDDGYVYLKDMDIKEYM